MTLPKENTICQFYGKTSYAREGINYLVTQVDKHAVYVQSLEDGSSTCIERYLFKFKRTTFQTIKGN